MDKLVEEAPEWQRARFKARCPCVFFLGASHHHIGLAAIRRAFGAVGASDNSLSTYHALPANQARLHRPFRPACSVGWWLMAGAGLFWEKSTAGWLLVCCERKVLLAGGRFRTRDPVIHSRLAARSVARSMPCVRGFVQCGQAGKAKWSDQPRDASWAGNRIV
jgi:hypothetical protein